MHSCSGGRGRTLLPFARKRHAQAATLGADPPNPLVCSSPARSDSCESRAAQGLSYNSSGGRGRTLPPAFAILAQACGRLRSLPRASMRALPRAAQGLSYNSSGGRGRTRLPFARVLRARFRPPHPFSAHPCAEPSPARDRGSVRVLPLLYQKKKRSRRSATFSFFSRGRTRTYDLRVMSPTSCQLLYPASMLGRIYRKR